MNLPLFIRHYPLIAITLSYIAGITFSFYLSPPIQIIYFLLLACGMIVLLAIRRKTKLSQPALFIFFFLAGLLNGTIDLRFPESPQHIYTQVNEAEESIILGTVQQTFGFNGRTSKFDVSISAMRTASTDFATAAGKVRCNIEGPLAKNIIPGKNFAIRIKLRRPQRYATPGSFDYPLYLARHDIYATGYISSPLYIQPIDIAQSLYHKLYFSPEVLRTQINTFIDSHLEGDQAAIYKALLTGDRSSISPAVLETFKGSGCLHILAISGLHMSLLGIILYHFFFWLLRRSTWLINRINTKKTALGLCIIPLLFYTLIAGAKTPVLRSFIMSLVVIIAICYGKKHSFACLVSLAALLVLFLSPINLATPSFQLTFAAVISIAAAIPFLKKTRAALKSRMNNEHIFSGLNWLITGIGISAAATLGTAPLLIHHFNFVSLVGVLANLLVEPMICLWSLTIGFIAIFFIFIYPPLAELFLMLGSEGILLAIKVTAFFHSLPYASMSLPTMSIAQIVLYYLTLALLILHSSLSTKYRVLCCIILLMTITSTALPITEITKHFAKESTLTYLDVGHGSCTLIETPQGRRILIDAGGLSSPRFDIGKRVIIPFLFEKKIITINDVVVTHADSDHYNGILSILDQFRVQNLWVSLKDKNDDGWQRLLNRAAAVGTEVLVPQTNNIIARNDSMELEVVANTTEITNLSADNDNGLIIKYHHDNLIALFPGDISREVEKKLVGMHMDLKAQILLAAHHGSATSNSRDFLTTIQPDLMIVSSGRSSAGTFPSASVTARCKTLGIPVISTKTDGTITIQTHQGDYSVETFFQRDNSPTWISNNLRHR